MQTEVDLPNAGKVKGMIIKKGVTLIVGGGFHGVAPHAPPFGPSLLHTTYYKPQNWYSLELPDPSHLVWFD